jgi:ankyrin repeat protein
MDYSYEVKDNHNELLNYIKFDLNHNDFFKKLLINNVEDEKILKHIIDNAVNLECETKINKWRPIHYICQNSTPEIIKYIIDKGVDLECEDYMGLRPIHLICRYSTPEMIKYIIDKGVDLECETFFYEWRPIHFICKYSTPEMIKYIIDKGVDLDCENEDGWRPIHFICYYHSAPEMIKYIIDKGINLDFNDELELEKFINKNNKLSIEETEKMIEYINNSKNIKNVMVKKAILKKIENKLIIN